MSLISALLNERDGNTITYRQPLRTDNHYVQTTITYRQPLRTDNHYVQTTITHRQPLRTDNAYKKVPQYFMEWRTMANQMQDHSCIDKRQVI